MVFQISMVSSTDLKTQENKNDVDNLLPFLILCRSSSDD
jgi:hypothetical protein